MTSQNSCCVPGCVTTKKDGIPLHRFPDPEVDADRFNTWISKIGGEVAKMDNLDVYGNRRVCHKHFEKIIKYPRNRLSRIAIPVLDLSVPPQNEITAPAPSSTVDAQETKSDIQMRDPLFTESNNMLLCPTSGVLETRLDIQMREQPHTERVAMPAVPSTSGTLLDIHMRGIKRTCIIPDRDDELLLLKKKLKEEYQLADDTEKYKKDECNECLSYHNDVDDRNRTFSQLIEQELKDIKPCIRTRCYIDILEYIQSVKGKHIKDLDKS